MTARSYQQFCGLAKALDVLGERWTLLVVRELALGPKRYRDLLAALPGIGTNLLAARLKSLEADGVIERTIAPSPAGTPVYALTERGEALRPMIAGLALWGFELLPAQPDGETLRASWAALSMRAGAVEHDLAGLDATVAFTVEDERFFLQVAAGELILRHGAPAADPDAHVIADRDAFFALADRRMTPAQGVKRRVVRVEGDRRVVDRLLAAVHLPERNTARG
ncbi:hypothetical protein DSM104299_03696 [Baekduia alba]|uniref:winged helix-turn-helix transcriptional regulator n=1 Tax=Baekduia alba TaxID=2997333 RepID=UPI002340207B|nr:winged helix-turn-helix transcriptional regulator [Baekduia alba]WCB94956.1 hypothetical protein DSM104299_03696 [Baekduia alba]